MPKAGITKERYGNGRAIFRKSENQICGRILFIVFLAAVIAVFGCQMFLVCILRVPKTFREMTMIKYAVDFSRGMNPYAQELLSSDFPFNSGCYGCLQALMTGFLLKLVSVEDALLVAELFSIALDMTTAMVMYFILRSRKCERWIALFAVMVVELVLFCYGAAYPHSVGMLLMLLLIFLINRDNRRKEFHPAVYAVIAVLSFYAKQYFLLTAPCVFVYLLIQSPKDSRKLLLYGLLFGFGSLFAVWNIFPLYIPLTLVRASIDSNMKDLNYAISQLYQAFIMKYLAVTVLAFLGFLILAVKTVRVVGNQWVNMRSKILICLRTVSYEGVSLIVSFLPVVEISKNQGQFCEYFEQLLVPYACIIGAMALNKLWKPYKQGTIRTVVSIFLVCMALFAGWNNFQLTAGKVFTLDIGHLQRSWKETEQILDQFAPEQKMIVPALLSNYCMVRDIYTDDYGQAQYNSMTAMRKLKRKPLYDKLFPAMDKIISMTLDYRGYVQSNIDKGYYELLMLNSDNRGSLNCHNLKVGEGNYELYGEKKIPTPVGEYLVKIYIRK